MEMEFCGGNQLCATMATPICLSCSLSPTVKLLSCSSAAAKKSQQQNDPSLLLVEGCTSMAEVKQIHAQMIRSGLATYPLPASRLVAVCTGEDIGSLSYARLLFDQIPKPTTFTFNSIIRGYTNRNLHREALSFYVDVVEIGLVPDKFTLPSLLKCSRGLEDGRQLHCHAIKFGLCSDPYVQNTLMSMYSSCSCLDSACQVFNKMSEKTVVSWATMIAAFTKCGRPTEALGVYKRMKRENVKPNEVTLLNVLTASASARDLESAKGIVEHMKANDIRLSIVLSAALMNVYCKCGQVSLAKKLFDDMPERNLVCWNIMIKVHVEDNDYSEALQVFREMQLLGIRGDKVTMASLVVCCTHLGALDLGKWLHAYIKREGIEMDVVLGTALVEMYGKCGCAENAMKVFEEMTQRNVMVWTALICGLAMCGRGEEALQVFDNMGDNGVKPDSVTFVGVLTACTHAGLVEEGCAHFETMRNVYNIQPTIEHYGCMVDLFGRAGELEKALELIRTMPMPPDNFVLGGLLGACRIHDDIHTAERTARQLHDLLPEHHGTYVLLANIYSSMGRWDEAERVRGLMKERGVRKPPGCSMVEIGSEVHEFFMGDESHSRSAGIYPMVDGMMERISAAKTCSWRRRRRRRAPQVSKISEI